MGDCVRRCRGELARLAGDYDRKGARHPPARSVLVCSALVSMLHFPFTSTLALSHFPFSRRVHFCQSLHTIPLALSPQRLAHILLFSLAHPLCARQEEDLLPLVVQVHATGFVCPEHRAL